MIELSPTDIAHAGEAVARHNGKAHFIAGAMPGERVRGDVVVDKGSWARVELTEVLERSDHRVEPPCPHFARCGGCQWQFVDYDEQLKWKAAIVRGQLQHLGRIAEPPVTAAIAPGPAYGYRNRMDFKVVGGKPALHQHRSQQLVPLDVCMLLQPQLRDLFDRLGDLSGVRKLTVRASATTGERLVVITGDVPEHAQIWDATIAVRKGRTVEKVAGPGSLHETVVGVDFRVTADAFFQNNTAGAQALVELVDRSLDIGGDDTLLDAFAGGGLFAATVGRRAGRVVAIEGARQAFSDLRRNTKRAGMDEIRLVRGNVMEAVPYLDEYWQAVIVDPPRSGLGEDGVDAVTAADPRVVVYVSCDPASLARDARLLRELGYVLESATPVDLFPQTYHVETVATFRLTG